MIDYDPYSHEAMTDAFPLYARLRAESPVHYIEKYDCWALSRFQDVWDASLDQEHFTARGGQSPGQVMLGEAIPRTFMTMDPPEHRSHRSVIGAEYTRRAAERDAPRIRGLAREICFGCAPAGSRDEEEGQEQQVQVLLHRISSPAALARAALSRFQW